MWEKYHTAGQTTNDNMAQTHFMLDNWGYKHTLTICNTTLPLQQRLHECASELRICTSSVLYSSTNIRWSHLMHIKFSWPPGSELWTSGSNCTSIKVLCSNYLLSNWLNFALIESRLFHVACRESKKWACVIETSIIVTSHIDSFATRCASCPALRRQMTNGVRSDGLDTERERNNLQREQTIFIVTSYSRAPLGAL